MTIRPMETELFHAYEWMGRRKGRHNETNSRFLQICKRP